MFHFKFQQNLTINEEFDFWWVKGARGCEGCPNFKNLKKRHAKG